MFAGAIYPRKRFFMQQADQIIAVGNLAKYLHNQHIVVNGQIEILEHWCQLKLGRSHFVMSSACRNPKLPQLQFDFRHEFQNARLDRTKIMIIELLMFRRRCSEKCASGLQQIRALQIEFLVDQEVFLFDSHGDFAVRFGLSE